MWRTSRCSSNRSAPPFRSPVAGKSSSCSASSNCSTACGTSSVTRKPRRRLRSAARWRSLIRRPSSASLPRPGSRIFSTRTIDAPRPRMKYHPGCPALPGRCLAALLALVLLSGADQPVRMQYRTFLRGNLQARGPIQPNGEARFVSLSIGDPKKPLNDETPFYLRLSSGKVMESADFTVARIADLAGTNKLVLEKSDWGRGAVEYSFEG